MGDLTARLGDRVPPGWRERIALYGTALLLTYALFLGSAVWLRLWAVDPAGFPVAGDFVAFWSGGRMALEGRAVQAYNAEALRAVQMVAIGRPFDGWLLWLNPPHYFFYVTPFAVPPYLLGWLLWNVSTFLIFVLALRLVVPSFVVPALLAAPASLWCAVTGQNGYLSAALMAGCLALMERRPVLAGMLLGLLTYKPQFGLIFPPALLAGRRWAVIASAIATTVSLIALSIVLFGTESWQAFLASANDANRLLSEGGSAWAKLQSPYAVAFQISGSLRVAAGAQIVITLGLAAAMVWVWAAPAPFACKAAALVAGAYLATPYSYIYDAPILTTAAAFLVRDGLERGFGRAAKVAIPAALLMPVGFMVLGSAAGFGSAALLLGLALARAKLSRQALVPAHA